MRRLVLLLIAALLAGCALVDNDPLHIGGEFGTTVQITVDVGQQVAFGSLSIRNVTDDRFILTAARFVPFDLTYGAPVTAVYAISSLDVNGVLGGGRWPQDAGYPDAVLHPVAGYQLLPGHTVHLLFVLDVEEAGRWVYTGTEVDYVGSHGLYQGTAVNTFIVCADLTPDCRSVRG